MSPAQQEPRRTFLSFSQLLLKCRSSEQQPHRPKVSYLQVQVLDQETGVPLSIIDKVHPSSTVLDLKNRFHKACPGWCPSRTGLRANPYGPILPDTCVIATIGTSSLVSVYPTDLGRQVGWTAVFVSQYFGPLLIYLVFYLRLSSVYDDTANSQRPLVVHLACFCHSLHYIKHLLETLFVHKLSDGYTPLQNLFKGCAFYGGFSAWLGYYINHPLYTPPYYANKQIIPSLIWFLFCEAGHFCINIALAQHNHMASCLVPTRNPFTWLCRLVHCPQYTYEIGVWLSFAIMTQTVPAAVFAVLVSAQLVLRGQRRHRKYLRRRSSGEGGGSCGRTAVIPFIL